MAEPSEHLTHPILGTLGWLSEYSHWFGQLPAPDGGTLDLVVDPGDGDRYEFLSRAAELFQWAMANERRVRREAINLGVMELYEGWRQETEPVLTAVALFDHLRWEYLEIGWIVTCPLTFSYDAGEFFGGHCVSVTLNAQIQYRAA